MLKFICVTFLFIALIQLIDGRYNHTAYNLCLYCHNVRTPQDCTHFVEIWQNEVCTAERVRTLNGTIVWNFGFEDATLCTGDELIRTSRSLSARRIRAGQQPGFVLCHECCHTSLCNHKLCGSPTNNDLLCLSGEETQNLPPISHAVYCYQNQSCYASMRMNSRPEQFPINYGCVLKDVCRELHNMDSHGYCQRCCESDGCNANICLVQPSDVDAGTGGPSSQAPTTGQRSRTDSLISEAPSTDQRSSTDSPISEAPSTDQRSSTNNPISEASTTDTRSSTDSPISEAPSTDPLFTDCSDLQSRGGINESGVYEIHPIQGSNASLYVRCDMVTDGGGWTVLQRRFDGSLNFTRSMSEYVEGFGDVSGEHWLGLRWITLMTSQDAVQMRVDLCRFGDYRAGYAVYEGFSVSGPGDNYRLHTGVYMTGSMRDELWYHDGREFQVCGPCADTYRGGWWYYNCFYANLNGGRYNGGSTHGIVWHHFGGHASYPNVTSSELKIRPINTPGDPTHPYTCSS